MKFLRKLFDKAARRIARRQLSDDYAGYLRSLKESWCERDRLKKMWEEVHIENRRLRIERNEFFNQCGPDFEEALGPHPHGEGVTGNWINRIRIIRAERDKLNTENFWLHAERNHAFNICSELTAHKYGIVELFMQHDVTSAAQVEIIDEIFERQRAKAAAVSACGCDVCKESKNNCK